jgi:HSP20 family molecular chaperone IbpA
MEIRMEPRRLTISGKRETSEEHKKGKTIVDNRNLTAMLKNGVLELQISKSVKSSKSKATRIEVKSV